MSIKPLALALGAILGCLAVPGCNLDIPDLNNPGLEQLENNPTAAGLNTASTGLLIGNRGGKSAPVGLVNLLGILGRESYDFDTADARFNAEMIQGNLSKASPFGGAFWAGPYANIRLANIILHGIDKVPEFTPENQSAMQGFAHTIIALELLTVIVTHDDTGAVIQTDLPLGQLGPFVKKDAVYAEIAKLLDMSQTELVKAGTTAFTFPLSPGYKGFDTPATFIKFNRAIRARVAVYQNDYAKALDALGASFLDDTSATPNLNTGVFYVYATTGGDATNQLINKAIYAHPKLKDEAQMQMGGMTLDARYTAKVRPFDSNPPLKESHGVFPSDPSLQSDFKFQIYPSNTTPLALIRNEELILLKAEALWFTGDHANALKELNLVRTLSGKLPALQPADIPDDTAFVTALLYERRYSLMFEGGHRWIDLRRFGIPLPLDASTHVRNIRFPVPQAECDARPGELACTINSSDPVP